MNWKISDNSAISRKLNFKLQQPLHYIIIMY